MPDPRQRHDIRRGRDVRRVVEYSVIASGVLGKEYGSVSPCGNEPSLFDGQEGLELALPGEGFELYWHMNADRMRTRGWHGYY